MRACLRLQMCVRVCVCVGVWKNRLIHEQCEDTGGASWTQHLSLLWSARQQQRENTAWLSNTHIQYIQYTPGVMVKQILTWARGTVAPLTVSESWINYIWLYKKSNFLLSELFFFFKYKYLIYEISTFSLLCNCTVSRRLLAKVK